jgi:hypothetical protein
LDSGVALVSEQVDVLLTAERIWPSEVIEFVMPREFVLRANKQGPSGGLLVP